MDNTDKKAALPLTFEIKYATLAGKGSILHIRPKSAEKTSREAPCFFRLNCSHLQPRQAMHLHL